MSSPSSSKQFFVNGGELVGPSSLEHVVKSHIKRHGTVFGFEDESSKTVHALTDFAVACLFLDGGSVDFHRPDDVLALGQLL